MFCILDLFSFISAYLTILSLFYDFIKTNLISKRFPDPEILVCLFYLYTISVCFPHRSLKLLLIGTSQEYIRIKQIRQKIKHLLIHRFFLIYI